MKEKVTGIISFIGAIGWGLIVLFLVIKEAVDSFHIYSIIMGFAVLLPTISTVLYVVWTKFGKMEHTEIEKMEYENQLLKKQIEQKELREKLERK